MPLSPDEIRKVAELARLTLEPEHMDDHVRQLCDILTLVDGLQKADTAAVAPMAHPLDLAARLRPDAVTEADVREACQAIAPAVEAGLYLVPRVIE
ncbi:MAG: Asp-tRNA(Asn)/Glu-tRNA(Gln) amidotransferase subunit GatC [Salinisphaera sp.]|nr:Asp-tRNA(Asn)/Glu-tRNA(Gln) amidotransferase subunit GatC [Salinisphaera sp.]